MRVPRWRDWPLRLKVVLALLVASLVPMAITLAIAYQAGVAQQREALKDRARAAAGPVVAQLDGFLDFYKRLVQLFSQSKSIKDYYLGEPEERRKDTAERFRDGMQRRVSEAKEQLVAMAVLNAAGRVDIASDP